MQYFDLNEDEMMQLAAEMSISDVIENLSRHWTDQDLSETRDTLKLLTEIMESNRNEFGASIDENDEVAKIEPASPYLPTPVLPSHIRNDPIELFAPTSKTSSFRIRDKRADHSNTLNALVTVASKLRYFHKKMLQFIEHNGPEVSFTYFKLI